MFKCLKTIVYHKLGVSKPNDILIFPMMTGFSFMIEVIIHYTSIFFFSLFVDIHDY